MKLTCDLCGGALQMNAGAKDASCKNCGLCYSLEMLRQKLGMGEKPVVKDPVPVVPPVAEDPKPAPIVPPVVEDPTPAVIPVAQTPQAAAQFVMQVTAFTGSTLIGTVQQGCIGVGEPVYLNGDYSKPYKLYRFDSDTDKTHATAGEQVEVELNTHNKNVLRQVGTLTGDPQPAMNAYRFDGSVEDYFAYILQEQFGQYGLRRQVQWPGLRIPITFMLTDVERPAVAILLFDSSDAHSRYEAQLAQRYFATANIGCTHFFSDYRNDAPYVAERISQVIR